MKHDEFLERPYTVAGEAEAHAEAAIEAERMDLTAQWLHDATSFGILLQYPEAHLTRVERWLRARAIERLAELEGTIAPAQARQTALAAALQDLDSNDFGDVAMESRS